MNNKKFLKIGLLTPYENTAPPSPQVIRAPQHLWSILARRLQERGHNVTLFAPVGSRPSAILPAKNLTPLAVRRDYKKIMKNDGDFLATKIFRTVYNELAIAHFLPAFAEFDLIHSVFLPEALPVLSLLEKTPVLFTFHDPLTPERIFFMNYYWRKKIKHFYYNSISYAQREGVPKSRFFANVHNGINLKLFRFAKRRRDGDYLLFAGRMRAVKGPHIAIKAALALDLPLKLVGEKFPDEQDYWDLNIAPYLADKIEYLGMQPREKMSRLYGGARVLLFPAQWPEPFGLVLIEALACGTPVIAFRQGAVREIIKDGVTGFIVDSEEQMIEAVRKIYALDQKKYQKMRLACRRHMEKKFSTRRMVEGYERVYYRIVGRTEN